jgi:hypothetical protein
MVGAKDGGAVIPSRGELKLEIDGAERVFVYEVPDILTIEETAGLGISALFRAEAAGVKVICVCLCSGILYTEPTMTPARIARMLGKPVRYLGPDVTIKGDKPRTYRSGQRVDLGALYAIVRHYVNLALPDLEEAPKGDEEVKANLPPPQAAG